MSLLNEGEIIGVTYEVERLLGEGEFAEVYRVKHRFLGRQAMKVFKLVGMTIAEVERALAEACLLSRIGHPNIIRVFDANVSDSSAGQIGYFTMEYVAGGTLNAFRRTYGNSFIPVSLTLQIIRQVCCGLAVAHSAQPPIIHRDVKPQNILVGYDDQGPRVRLSDFGLAKHVNPLTLQASARGTRSFKPPESFEDVQSDSPAGDVWAVGLCFYLLLTDTLPYLGENDPDEAVPAIPTRAWRPPSDFNVQVDRETDEVVHRALALRSSERYRDAVEFLTDLDRIVFRRCPSTTTGEVPNSMAEVPALEMARKMAEHATALAREATRLGEAASLLERALEICPMLRRDYGYRLELWRKGVAQ